MTLDGFHERKQLERGPRVGEAEAAKWKPRVDYVAHLTL